MEGSPTHQPDGDHIDGFEMSGSDSVSSDEDVFNLKTTESTEPDSTT